MMFCPKCGSILMPKNNSYACSCGFKSKAKKDVKIIDRVNIETKDVKIVSDSEKLYPIIETECPFCGNNKAEHWMVQMRASDEPETSFFKCTKCHKKWKKNE